MRDIKRKTRTKFTSEEKIKIVIDGLQLENNKIDELGDSFYENICKIF